jgi:hypothetical protein
MTDRHPVHALGDALIDELAVHRPGQAISYKVGQKVILDLRRDFLRDGGDLAPAPAGLGDRGLGPRAPAGAGYVGVAEAR